MIYNYISFLGAIFLKKKRYSFLAANDLDLVTDE